MWDSDLITRVRDRKLNEIMIFGSMAKIDSANIDMYVDLIVSLGDDVDACDTLLDTKGEAEIELDAISYPAYIQRLSESEKADENAFNSLKSEPSAEAVEESLEDYVRSLIEGAVESLRTPEPCDALEALKEELMICRARVEQLSKELDFSKGNELSLQEEIDSLKEQLDMLADKNDGLRSENASLKIELNLAEEKLSVLEPAYQQAVSAKPIAEAPAIEPQVPVEPEPVSEIPVAEDEPAPETPKDDVPDVAKQYGGYISKENAETLRKVRAMKDSKIDLLIDAAASGKMSVTICDDIIDFLKTDVQICDAVLSIDFSDKDSVFEGFRKILAIVEDSKDPVHQDEYVKMLDADEAFLEYSYSQVLNSLQGMIMYIKDELFPKA